MRDGILSKREYETLSQFCLQLRRFLRFSEEVAREVGVTHRQYLLLLGIAGMRGREWATVGELTESLQTSRAAVLSLVARSEKAGLVFRERSRTDRREIEVHLAADGAIAVEKLACRHRDELARLQGIFRVPGSGEID